MQTTHVIRGEEWLPSAPKHALLFEQMGWQAPKYAHLSLILIVDKETGNKRKFSKRKGDPSFLDIIRMGYLPEGVFNYLALLGWNPGAGETKEIFTKEEFISLFQLENCNKSGALYDQTKLDWVNGEHLAKLSIDELTDRLATYLSQHEPEFFTNVFSTRSREFNQKIITELRSRLKRFNEYIALTGFFYHEPSINLSLLVNEKMKIDSIETARTSLAFALEILESKTDFSSLDTIKSSLLGAITERGLKNGPVLWPLRVALSGEAFSP
jgi:glutamyl/glutaminyl-tRNA synthetase